jgi:hypothetical protein
MTTLKVRFDGRVLVPEHAVDLPQGRILEIHIADAEPQVLATTADIPDVPAGKSTLAALADWAEQLPGNPDSPTDGAAQHDHYLYGTPKRP